MLVIGLTGSVGMGKSTTAAFFREAGVAVHDSDAAVHALYSGEAAALVEAAFPGSVKAGAVDRFLLAARVTGDTVALRRLETIIHPLVRRSRERFCASAEAAGAKMIVLDVPLLFEIGADASVDLVVVVSASKSVQKARVLARPGMTEARFEAILARQVPDAIKRQRSHVIIDTGRGFEMARRQVRDVLRAFAAAAQNGKSRKTYA